MVALHAQLPDQKLASYVQANLDHAELRHALMYRAFDQFGRAGLRPNGPARDWNAEFKRLYDGIHDGAKRTARKADSTRVLNTKPSLPPVAYAGTYSDSLYGQAVVTAQDGGLLVSLNNVVTGRLSHWHFDTFRLTYDTFWDEPDLVSFALDGQGRVAKLTWGGMTLTRLPDKPRSEAGR